MDFMLKGLCPKTKISFIYTDVTETAKELERRHLSGPTAGRLLGEMLTAVSLLSSNLGNEDERVTLQLKVDGPLGGGMVEANRGGDLRGYTHTKILNNFDGDENAALAPALGEHGLLSVIQSTQTGVTQSGQVHADPPDIRSNLARYCYQSLQRPMGVELQVTSEEGYLNRAAGIIAERMPDGDSEAFVRVLEHFEDGSLKALLAKHPEFGEISTMLGLDDLTVVEMRSIQFGCSCNRDKIAAMMKNLAEGELKEIVEEGEGTAVTCHFCGHHYTLPHDEVEGILHEKMSE
ncbi:MAG: Hsp33 family molecular chaperone HslO [Planctomycetota bacterium]|jgi:molecular chaperone Hsp33